MRIEAFLKLSGKTLAQAHEETGFSVMAFRHWIAGARLPSRASLRRLGQWSDGAITPADYFEKARAA